MTRLLAGRKHRMATRTKAIIVNFDIHDVVDDCRRVERFKFLLLAMVNGFPRKSKRRDGKRDKGRSGWGFNGFR